NKEAYMVNFPSIGPNGNSQIHDVNDNIVASNYLKQITNSGKITGNKAEYETNFPGLMNGSAEEMAKQINTQSNFEIPQNKQMAINGSYPNIRFVNNESLLLFLSFQSSQGTSSVAAIPLQPHLVPWPKVNNIPPSLD